MAAEKKNYPFVFMMMFNPETIIMNDNGFQLNVETQLPPKIAETRPRESMRLGVHPLFARTPLHNSQHCRDPCTQ